MTNEKYLKDLPGVDGVKYYDVKSAVEDITAGSFAKLNYTSSETKLDCGRAIHSA